MAQQQIKGEIGSLGNSGTLTTYVVPGSATVEPVSASAVFDGTNASGSFLPCLTFKTITGAVIARCPAPEVAAGDTAEVSWFPRVAAPTAATLAPYWQNAYVAETCDRTSAGMTPVGLAFDPPGVGYVGFQQEQPAGRVVHGLWVFLTQLGSGTPPTNMQLALINSAGVVRAVTGNITADISSGSLGYRFFTFTDTYRFPRAGWYYAASCSTGVWSGAGSRDPAAAAMTPEMGGTSSATIFDPIDRADAFALALGTLSPGDVVPLTGITYRSDIPWYGLA